MEGCGRKLPDSWANELLLLYQDCKQRSVLPKSGGLFDQPADIIRWFRIIDDHVAKRQQEKRALGMKGRHITDELVDGYRCVKELMYQKFPQLKPTQ